MKKFCFPILTILALAGICHADTTTARLGLVKPSIGSAGWGTKTNNNWDVVDSSVAVLSKTNVFTSTLTVNSYIKSTSGGFVFPDGSTQTTAGGGGGGATIGGTVIGGSPEKVLFIDDNGKLAKDNGLNFSTSSIALPGSYFPTFNIGSGQITGVTSPLTVKASPLGGFIAAFMTGNFSTATFMGTEMNVSGTSGVIGFNGASGDGVSFTPLKSIGISTNSVFVPSGALDVNGSGLVAPSGTFQVRGSFASITRTVTSTGTATSTDHVVFGDTTGTGFTFTLPDPATACSRQYLIKRISGGGNNLIVGTAAGLIDGFSTKVFSVQYEAYTFVSDCTNWWLF